MPAAALNAFHTMWLRQATDSDLTLTVHNHPLPMTANAAVYHCVPIRIRSKAQSFDRHQLYTAYVLVLFWLTITLTKSPFSKD